MWQGGERSGFYFTGVSAQANLAIGSVQSMAVVVFCAYLIKGGGGGGKRTAVTGTITNIWFSLFTLVLRGDANRESDRLYSEVYIGVVSCWPG